MGSKVVGSLDKMIYFHVRAVDTERGIRESSNRYRQ